MPNHALVPAGRSAAALIVALAGAAAAQPASRFTTAPAKPAERAADANPGMFRYPDVSAREIVFVYANDLWVVPREGGLARPLASPPGQETFPRFSPDGRSVAFVGNYEGNRDLYTVASDGGVPLRVTHHPGAERLHDWTPGGDLLFSFNALSGNPAQQRLFTFPPEGGLPEPLPVPYGAAGSISADGGTLAYTPDSRDFRTWKRYAGGLATDIWTYDLESDQAERITDWPGTDTAPMWHDGVVYYLSDQGEGSRLNIWRYDPAAGERRQITSFTDHDVKFPAIGPGPDGNGEIVFQLGSRIHVLDLGTRRAAPVDIRVPGARATIRPRTLDAAEQLASAGISATGKRAVVEARGDIFTIPAEHGPTRAITDTSGVAERNPAWSPDGRWIAYFSDESGEYELYVTQSDGRGEPRRLTEGNQTYWMNLSWSPDSERILVTDKAGAMSLVDLESGDMTPVDTDPWASQPGVSWSSDSRWIAYALTGESSLNSALWLFDTQTGEKHKVTSGFFSDANPVFSPKNDYLFYTSNRNFADPSYEDVGSTFIYDKTGVLIAVPLNADIENPRLIESDEETWEDKADAEESGDAEDADKADKADDADEADDAEASDDDTPAHLAGYDTEHPLFGRWEGSATGLSAVGLPEDEVPFTLIVLVDKEGNITGRSEAMGETEDLADVVTWDADANRLTLESTDSGMTVIRRGTVTGDAMSGDWEIKPVGATGSWTAKRTTRDLDKETVESIAGDASDDAKELKIELDGFEARGVQLEVPPGDFSALGVNSDGHLLYIRGGEPAPSLKLYDLTADEPEEKTVLGVALGYDLSADHKKILARTPAGWAIVDAKPGQTAKALSVDLRKTVDPREEWRQIVTDAWRRHRDFFYVENMHGVDWQGVLDQYLPLVEDAVSREDVSYIIGEMIGELNVGHAYYWGGDVEDEPATNVGLLGVDFSVAEVTNDDGETVPGFRIDRIHHGAPWDSDARNPLQAAGLNVEVGDVITHVNGRAVDTSKDPWAAFIGTAGKDTGLTIVSPPGDDDDDADDADDADAGEGENADRERTIVVKPMGSDTHLRYRAWVEANRKYVEEASDGKVGYIYVPNTGVQGQNELFRQFYGQTGKPALLIDERWNGGGQIPNRFIELLNRPRTNYWHRRDGKDWPWPFDSHQGPKAMLINGNAGSGGDMFPWLFRHHGIGKLIGTRTWGGLVGITGVPGLIDGGYTAVPTFGFYETDGTWGIEGYGVAPDIEVIADPAEMTDGRDPQLDAGVAHLLEELKTNAYQPAPRPAPPVRSGFGIEEADR
jgi:tricorn protease-like protein/C-terminal processing protease CtpA/Prc